MYETREEARKAAEKFVGKYDIPPVIMERKLTMNAHESWFNFRFFGNEKFNPEWKEEEDHSYSRMIEIVQYKTEGVEKQKSICQKCQYFKVIIRPELNLDDSYCVKYSGFIFSEGNNFVFDCEKQKQ